MYLVYVVHPSIMHPCCYLPNSSIYFRQGVCHFCCRLCRWLRRYSRIRLSKILVDLLVITMKVNCLRIFSLSMFIFLASRYVWKMVVTIGLNGHLIGWIRVFAKIAHFETRVEYSNIIHPNHTYRNLIQLLNWNERNSRAIIKFTHPVNQFSKTAQ